MRKKSKKAISSILVLFVLFQIVCPVSSYAIENGGQETQETTNESLVMDENTGKDEDNSAQDSSKDEPAAASACGGSTLPAASAGTLWN